MKRRIALAAVAVLLTVEFVRELGRAYMVVSGEFDDRLADSITGGDGW